MIAFVQLTEEPSRRSRCVRADRIVSFREDSGRTIVEYHVGNEARSVAVTQSHDELVRRMDNALGSVEQDT